MKRKRILIAEDHIPTGIMLKEALESQAFTVTVETNGEDALKQFQNSPFKVIIIDINMPVMSGDQLIDHLKGHEIEPAIIVTTGRTEPETIIDIMKKGVYDYLVKPVNIQDFLNKVDNAFEAYELKRLRKVMEKEKLLKLSKQLDWYKWEEKFLGKDKIRDNKSLFKYLNQSFSQGAGFGSLIPIVNILRNMAQKNESGNYTIEIEEDLFMILQQNNDMAQKAMTTFGELDSLISKEIPLQAISCNDIYDFIDELRIELKNYSEHKEQSLVMSDVKPQFGNQKIGLNKDFFQKAVKELIINAMKFSVEKSPVIIMLDSDNQNFYINILNNPLPAGNDITGIPMEYENLVFEPFFRLSSFIYEHFETLDFGLGLSLVERIVTRHNGLATLSNITDFSEIKNEPVQKVNAGISLPLLA